MKTLKAMFNYKKWNTNLKIIFLGLTISLFIWAEDALCTASVAKMEVAIPQLDQNGDPVAENNLPKEKPCDDKLFEFDIFD